MRSFQLYDIPDISDYFKVNMLNEYIYSYLPRCYIKYTINGKYKHSFILYKHDFSTYYLIQELHNFQFRIKNQRKLTLGEAKTFIDDINRLMVTTDESEYCQLYSKWLMMKPPEFPHSGVTKEFYIDPNYKSPEFIDSGVTKDFYIDPNYVFYSLVGLTLGSLFLYHRYKKNYS